MGTQAFTPHPLPAFTAHALGLALALALTACGGGDDSADNGGGNTPEPPAPSVANELTLELLAGSVALDFHDCRRADGEGSGASFMHLLQAVARSDGVYLVENDEGCQNAPAPIDAQGMVQTQPTSVIRKVTGSSVQVWKTLWPFSAAASGQAPMPTVRHASGFHLSADGQHFWVSSYVAARSAVNFTPDAQELALYNAVPGAQAWRVHMPGVFHAPTASEDGGPDLLLAGTPGQPPGLADGAGPSARFTAPHDLEADASGLLYLIDKERIRTVDPVTREVRTLDHAALGITGPVMALNADAQGRIHALEYIDHATRVWHRLSDGRRVRFSTNVYFQITELDTFAIVGDDMVLARRNVSPALGPDSIGKGKTTLYRINAEGQMTPMTIHPDPSLGSVLLPQIMHLEYGPDGHLYAVLPQGLMVARNFR